MGRMKVVKGTGRWRMECRNLLSLPLVPNGYLQIHRHNFHTTRRIECWIEPLNHDRSVRTRDQGRCRV